MTRFLSPISAILCSALLVGLFGVSSVNAQSVYDDLIGTTDNLVLTDAANPSDSRDFSTDWVNQAKLAVYNRCNDWSQWCEYVSIISDLSYETHNYQVQKVSDYGFKLSITEKPNEMSGVFYLQDGIYPSFIYDDPSSTAVSYTFSYTFQNDTLILQSKPEHYISMSYHYVDSKLQTLPIFLSTYPITYPPGYQGEIIFDTFGSPELIRPEFDYVISGKNVTITHRKDLDKMDTQEFEDMIAEWNKDESLPDGEYYYLNKSDYQIFTTVSRNGFIDTEYWSKYSVAGDTFQIEVENYGIHTLSVDYLIEICYNYNSEFTEPYCFVYPPEDTPERDYTFTELEIDIDGTYKEGSTLDAICAYGFCVAEGVRCELEPTFLERQVCNFSKQINFGVINPSLLAFRGLVSSMFVTTSPTCDIPLQDTKIAGKTFPTSNFGQYACDRAQSFHSAFPIASIIVNFAFAMLLLRLIVSIINDLTDNDKHNLIEGL